MKILFVSLGCDKNLVDSEVMLGLLRDRGHEITNDEAQAEIIVVNTCSFIHDAREESVQTVLEMAELKKNGVCRLLIVSGCLAEKYRDEILEELPEVDAVVGTTAYDTICEVIDKSLEGERVQSFESADRLPLVKTRRVLTTGVTAATLKSVRAVINIVPIVLFRSFGAITAVCRWIMCWRMQEIWRLPA